MKQEELEVVVAALKLERGAAPPPPAPPPAPVQEPDVVGWFPLYQAACGGDSHSEDHAKVIATLIDHGVHPDQRTPNGETALMAAAYRGHAPCVAILVMKGADAHTTATDGPWSRRDFFWIAKTSVEQKVMKQEELE